ncbi:hypothetical protein HZI73_22235 [Vallitalea pronyensis]|uniref:Uncharacterized protein n=1 Tax=Vallitalea pronyensis TaxID=1348613 RepID=A0A8J8SIQ5_9FIRM|nr:hypothetical protein [Vallitalea pronyensis]QUI24851.1 hypothetical protein HZI73_22235 [Vallitalea pronyensis]
MKNLKHMIATFKAKAIEKKRQLSALAVTAFVMTATTMSASASEPYVAKSFLDDGITTLLVNIGADLVKTVLALVVILLPVGLTLWGIGFGVKKGIGFLKKNANKSIG